MPAKQKRRAFACPHCGRLASGKVAGVVEAVELDEAGGVAGPPAEWALVQCDQCHVPIVQVREDYGFGFDDDDPAVVYPAPRRLSFDIPRALRAEWEEARTCFEARAYRAAVVMVRRTLEGTCAANGVSERTLHKSLRKLADTGVLDATMAEWADALRLLGNKGAHFSTETVSRQDAEDALDFAEALLDYLYVFRKRFAEFIDRSTARTDE